MKLRIKQRKGKAAGAASGDIFVTCVECSSKESFKIPNEKEILNSAVEFDLDSNKICADIHGAYLTGVVVNIEEKEEKKEEADCGVYDKAEDEMKLVHDEMHEKFKEKRKE